MYCIYGTKIPTPLAYEYKEKFNLENPYDTDQNKTYKPTITYGSGDGTVNVESMRVCSHWKMVKK
jgi:hypothetical protein